MFSIPAAYQRRLVRLVPVKMSLDLAVPPWVNPVPKFGGIACRSAWLATGSNAACRYVRFQFAKIDRRRNHMKVGGAPGPAMTSARGSTNFSCVIRHSRLGAVS